MIEINGIEHPLRFTFNTKAKFCKAREIDLPEFYQMFSGIEKMRLNAFENLALFFLIALQEGARKEGTECAVTIDDIMELYSEDMPTVEKMIKLYAESESKQGGKVTARL